MLLSLLVAAQHRQQHRRTVDGRLCAAAFVFDRQTHTGCSDGSNPVGEHGREWCYVDAQVARHARQRSPPVVVCDAHSVAVPCAVVGRRRRGARLGLLRCMGFMRRVRCEPRDMELRARARVLAAPGDAFALQCPVVRAALRVRADHAFVVVIDGAPLCSG